VLPGNDTVASTGRQMLTTTVTVNAVRRAARIQDPVNLDFDVLTAARVDACFAQSHETSSF
jgi:hypothetical protein